MRHKYFYNFFVIVMLLQMAMPTIGQGEWKSFLPPGKAFELICPGEMKYGEKNLITDVGDIKVVTYMHQGVKDDPNFIYLLNYVDYPEGTFHLDSTELIRDFFHISIQTNLNDLKGQLVYKTYVPFGIHPGVLYRASYNNGGAIIKSKMFVIGDRFYALQVYTLAEKSLNPEMDRFLNGFKAGMKK